MTITNFEEMYQQLADLYNIPKTIEFCYIEKPYLSYHAKVDYDYTTELPIKICFVKPIIEYLSEKEAEHLIKHEFAHIFCGYKEQHGKLFKQQCMLMGCEPKYYVTVERYEEYAKRYTKISKRQNSQ